MFTLFKTFDSVPVFFKICSELPWIYDSLKAHLHLCLTTLDQLFEISHSVDIFQTRTWRDPGTTCWRRPRSRCRGWSSTRARRRSTSSWTGPTSRPSAPPAPTAPSASSSPPTSAGSSSHWPSTPSPAPSRDPDHTCDVHNILGLHPAILYFQLLQQMKVLCSRFSCSLTHIGSFWKHIWKWIQTDESTISEQI